MDDGQLIYSVECTDKASTPALLISEFKALEQEDSASYRGSPISAVLHVDISPSPVIRTLSEDHVVVPVTEENDVVSSEESLTYRPESFHKVFVTRSGRLYSLIDKCPSEK